MTEMLVIGGGLLGRELAQTSRGKFETAVTYKSSPIDVEGCTSHRMDITGDLALIKELAPEYIVMTAAMTNVDACETDREGAWKLNALGPGKVAKEAKDLDAKLIYVSTDYVFDGARGLYTEDDPTNPINSYGMSKLQGEHLVRDSGCDYAIARTSVLYGWNPRRPNFVTWALGELDKGRSINIVVDQYTSPTLSSNLAEMILGMLDEVGIFHTCGRERINRYDLAVKAARAFGLDEELIRPVSSKDLNWKARRPVDSSLDVSKISKLAKPLNVDEGLQAMAGKEMIG